ncbi:MAG: response regulator [Stenomitos frigidus ULC029]
MNSAASPPQPIQILIVEDESVIAFNLQETLEALAYSVPAIAVSGAQALHHAAEFRPDLVLMDIRIKGEIDGIQAAEQIWHQFQIPVIYVTGHSDKSTVERARLTAPFGYLLKPIKERELYVTIESALQRCEQERWMSTILNGLGDAVIVTDSEGRTQFLNPMAEALTGWKLAEAKAQPAASIFSLVDAQTRSPLENPLLSVLQQGALVRLEDNVLLAAKDGTFIPISDSIAPLRDNSGTLTGAVVVFRDMTTHRQAEERNMAIAQASQLKQQMAELERLNNLKDDFLNTVSHELRTPLANIKMAIRMLEIVLDQQGVLSPENNPSSQSLGRYMDILRSQCDQELFLVNDLLDLQRLNANVYDLELISISLLDWLPHLLEGFQVRAQERQLVLQVNLPADLPPLISDLPSLNRILMELLNNACKYTPPGEQIIIQIELETRSSIDTAVEAPATMPETASAEMSPLDSPVIVITVLNTGTEIPAAELSQIFEPFYRVPKGDRWKQGGTGLGLALVKKLVTCLSGSIRVESSPQQTCFVIELPCHPAPSPLHRSGGSALV